MELYACTGGPADSRFFYKAVASFLKNYRGLFGKGEDSGEEDEEKGPNSSDNGYTERWGWYISIERVAEIMRIPFNDVTDLGLIEFLNTMSYIKDKDAEERKQWKKQKSLR